jgi:hypothetical protein
MRVPGCRRWYVAFCALYWALVAPWSDAHAAGLDFADSAWSRAAHEHGLDPALLYALTLVESRRSLDGTASGPGPGSFVRRATATGSNRAPGPERG